MSKSVKNPSSPFYYTTFDVSLDGKKRGMKVADEQFSYFSSDVRTTAGGTKNKKSVHKTALSRIDEGDRKRLKNFKVEPCITESRHDPSKCTFSHDQDVDTLVQRMKHYIQHLNPTHDEIVAFLTAKHDLTREEIKQLKKFKVRKCAFDRVKGHKSSACSFYHGQNKDRLLPLFQNKIKDLRKKSS